MTDDFDGLTEAGVRGHDLLVVWSSLPARLAKLLFDQVRQGTPLLGVHVGISLSHAAGGPEVLGHLSLPTHLPFQRIRVQIEDRAHPVAAGIDDFDIDDEPFCLELLGDAHLLASYDGQQTDAKWDRPPRDAKMAEAVAGAEAWRLTQRHAPLVYVNRVGAGRICMNALGHSPESLRNAGFRRLVSQAARWLMSGA